MLIKIPVKGKAESVYWVRAFDLQAEVEQITGMISGVDKRKSAFAPVITEHEAGSYFFVIFLGLCIDSLGLTDGMGYVWLTTGKEHKSDALIERNKLADAVLDSAHQAGKFDEIIEVENKRDV